MTVIAALKLSGLPVLISDFLITDDLDAPHTPLPTRPGENMLLPRRIRGYQKKSLSINSRFVVGFAGDVEAGKYLFTELKNRFGATENGPAPDKIKLALDLCRMRLHQSGLSGELIGWTLQRRPLCFHWRSGLGQPFSRNVQQDLIIGSGTKRFRATLNDEDQNSEGYSPALRSAKQKAILRGIACVGRVLADEISSGENLLTAYGFGAELAIYDGQAFQFVRKIGYVFFNIVVDTDDFMTLHLGRLAVYQNAGAYSLLRVFNLAPENHLQIKDSSLAILTPLHDDMRDFISNFAPSDAPDIICSYYYVGFMVGDTEPRMSLRMVVSHQETSQMFRIAQRNDGGIAIDLDMIGLERRIQKIGVFPRARWKAGPDSRSVSQSPL